MMVKEWLHRMGYTKHVYDGRVLNTAKKITKHVYDGRVLNTAKKITVANYMD
jgi:hypothetical protein